jgi:hypothetical protein
VRSLCRIGQNVLHGSNTCMLSVTNYVGGGRGVPFGAAAVVEMVEVNEKKLMVTFILSNEVIHVCSTMPPVWLEHQDTGLYNVPEHVWGHFS